MTLPVLILSIAIAGLALPGAWLQFRRVQQEGTSEGLSVVFIALAATSATTWSTYGVMAHEALQTVVNTSGAMASALTLALMVRYSRQLLPAAIAVALYLPIMAAVGAVAGPGAIGAMATALGISSRLPQVYRSWRSPGGAAVSAANFTLSSMASVLWLVFAMMHDDAFVMVSALMGLTFSMYIIARTKRRDALANEGFVVATA